MKKFLNHFTESLLGPPMKKFLKHFTPDAPLQEIPSNAPLSSRLRGLSKREEAFLRTYSGASFNNGLYRIHHIDEMDDWTARVLKAFPTEYQIHLACFGYDWAGRHYALDYGEVRRKPQKPRIVLLEPGTGKVYHITENFTAFHNKELVKRTDPALGSDFYEKWLNFGGQVPQHSECIGYKKPLFSNYGGQDKVGNLEVIDMEKYWAFSAELLAEIREIQRKAGGPSLFEMKQG